MEKVRFPVQRKIRSGYEAQLRAAFNGEAPRGLWNHKLEFGAEVIRKNPSTAVKSVTYSQVMAHVWREFVDRHLESRLLRRHAFDFTRFEEKGSICGISLVAIPRTMLWAEDAALSLFKGMPSPQFRFRHVDCHTVCFVHEGEGEIATDFGLLRFKRGDFAVIPRGATYSVRAQDAVFIVMYEFREPVFRPDIGSDGYPYSLAALVPAQPEPIDDSALDGSWPVQIKRHVGKWNEMRYPFSPFDAIAWEGSVYPFVLQMEDIRALSSPDFHIDPNMLTVFVTGDERSSLQVFLPRWVHSLPYPHQNYVDEVLFNHEGYSARPEVKDGCATLHPAGTFHGPDIRLAARMQSKRKVLKRNLPWREEIGVMLEASSPLEALPVAERLEIPGYEESWYAQYEELAQKKGRKNVPA